MNRRSTKLKRKTWADHLGLDDPSRATGLESTSEYMLFILTARAFANLNHSTTGPHGYVRARQTPTSLIFPRPYRQHYSPLARSEEMFCDIQICDCVHHLLARLAICSVDTTIHLPKMLSSQHFLTHAFEITSSILMSCLGLDALSVFMPAPPSTLESFQARAVESV